jgi:transcriptional regulator with XRE-family HTH domain
LVNGAICLNVLANPNRGGGAIAKKKNGATSDDRAIAARIRSVRVASGTVQRELALALGVTVQQVHSYEHGTSRVSAGQLVMIARALGVPVSRLVGEDDSALPPILPPSMTSNLVRYFRVLDIELQKALLRLAQILASRAP